VAGEAWSKCVQSLGSRCSKTVPCARRAVEFGEVLVFVSTETGDDFVITADGDNLQCERERERERGGGGGFARYGSAPNPIAVLSSSLILTQGLLCTHKTDDITLIIAVIFVLIY